MMTGFLKILSVYVQLARASFFKEMTPSASSNFPLHLFFSYFVYLNCVANHQYFNKSFCIFNTKTKNEKEITYNFLSLLWKYLY